MGLALGEGGRLSVGVPSTHGVVGHVHWSSHGGIVLSCGLEFWLSTFIRV